MNIEQVICRLREFQKEHGNIEVRISGENEIWGNIFNVVTEDNLIVFDDTLISPKIQERKKVVIFCYEN